ncbi:MAG: protease inhibitor I42 family protein [Proteobacteria bacterium]|nr:protease inhibitor I42 family protein [Pseudomonadota bacterium]
MATARRAGLMAGMTLLGALAACGSNPSVPLGPKPAEVLGRTVTLTPENAGTTVTLTMDQQLMVRLPEEPARNMRWERDNTSAYADRGVVSARSGDPGFERERIDTNTFGAAGFDVWVFRPKAAGQQTLRFEYRRAGQVGMAEQSVTYTVTVK